MMRHIVKGFQAFHLLQHVQDGYRDLDKLCEIGADAVAAVKAGLQSRDRREFESSIVAAVALFRQFDEVGDYGAAAELLDGFELIGSQEMPRAMEAVNALSSIGALGIEPLSRMLEARNEINSEESRLIVLHILPGLAELAQQNPSFVAQHSLVLLLSLSDCEDEEIAKAAQKVLEKLGVLQHSAMLIDSAADEDLPKDERQNLKLAIVMFQPKLDSSARNNHEVQPFIERVTGETRQAFELIQGRGRRNIERCWDAPMTGVLFRVLLEAGEITEDEVVAMACLNHALPRRIVLNWSTRAGSNAMGCLARLEAIAPSDETQDLASACLSSIMDRALLQQEIAMSGGDEKGVA